MAKISKSIGFIVNPDCVSRKRSFQKATRLKSILPVLKMQNCLEGSISICFAFTRAYVFIRCQKL